MRPPIDIDRISKQYEDIKALKDISFQVNEAEIFGLIGPDGAGKTSMFRILTTLLLPDAGEAYVQGYHIIKDYKKIREIIGYMPGRFSLYQDLSVEENLSLFASIFGTTIEENYELVKEIYSQIEPFKDRRAGQLSGGMKQKLALSCALIHKPEVLFLDEPTTGVDPVSRKEFWGILKNLKAHGITILVSTPYMDEANMCDNIGLIQNGEILSIDTPAKMMQDFDRDIYAIKTKHKYKFLNVLKSYEYTYSVFSFGDSIHYIDKRNNLRDSQLISSFNKMDLPEFIIEKTNPTVEDCFMDLMKQQ
ncbi:MAG: ABC transporter ATP-binding protein [Cyclobacteriaceae bacterium]|jgi:ABC-type multidrug transport system ATPase subunit